MVIDAVGTCDICDILMFVLTRGDNRLLGRGDNMLLGRGDNMLLGCDGPLETGNCREKPL